MGSVFVLRGSYVFRTTAAQTTCLHKKKKKKITIKPSRFQKEILVLTLLEDCDQWKHIVI
jgi:hypothetical protein